MVVKFMNVEYHCEVAEKQMDSITLKRKNGFVIAEFSKVQDISLFTLEGGEWTMPVPTIDQRTAALECAMLAMLGGGTNV